MHTVLRAALSTLTACCVLSAPAAFAADIAHISSASGYVLAGSGTAATAAWSGQKPLRDFSGYGQINYNGQCLTGRNGNQPLTWEGCRGGDKAQIWSLKNGRLNNEGGWCADVEGNRNGAGVKVLAWQCTGAINQQWRAHRIVTAEQAAAPIGNAAVRSTFIQTARSAPAGAVISLSTGKMVAAGGGNMMAAGGGNMVAAGGGNMVAAGGGN